MFKNKYGELRSGWMLAMSLVLVNLIQFVAGIIIMFQISESDDQDVYFETFMELMTSPIVNSIVYSLMIGLLLLLFWIVYKRPLRQLGLYREGWIKQLLLGGLFGIVSITLATLVLLVFGMARADRIELSGLTSSWFFFAFLFFTFVGFYEELLVRGVMMTALKTTRNKWVILLLPSVLFGLLHILNDNITIFSLINLALVGLLLAYLFIKTGRLWTPIGFHITWNFFLGNAFGIPVSGLSFFSIATIQLTGPDWLTGGAFGIEGGAICTLVTLLGLLFTHFFIKDSNYWRMDSGLPLTRGLGSYSTFTAIRGK